MDQPPSSGLQATLDRAIDRAILWAIPRSLRPNHLTALRFLLAPVVYVLLVADQGAWGAAVLVLGLCTDFIDGAMARRRDQITNLGIVIDPLADKLIVAAALVAIGLDYLVVWVILGLIVVEALGVAAGTLVWARTGKAIPANVFGKIKMVLLSVGLVLFLVGRLAEAATPTNVAVVILWAGIGFGVVSALTQVLDRRRVS